MLLQSEQQAPQQHRFMCSCCLRLIPDKEIFFFYTGALFNTFEALMIKKRDPCVKVT